MRTIATIRTQIDRVQAVYDTATGNRKIIYSIVLEQLCKELDRVIQTHN